MARSMSYREPTMKGTIRTKEKCPKCKGKLSGQPLRCPICKTTPEKYFIDLPWKGARYKLYTDANGYVLDSWAIATRLLERIRSEIDSRTFNPKEYSTGDRREFRFENYVSKWLLKRQREVEQGLITNTYLNSVKVYVRNYHTPFFSGKSIRDINAALVGDFADSLPTHLAPKTMKNILNILELVLQFAYQREDIPKIPPFPKIQVPEYLPKAISFEDQEAILAHIKCPVKNAFYQFLRYTGCRPGEARALKWENINLKTGMVSIKAAMDGETYKPFPKNKREREFCLHPDMVQILRSLPTRAISGYVFHQHGKPLHRKVAWETWAKAADKAGIDITCYQGTKHSLATMYINMPGARADVLQAQLGHADIRTTQKYGKLKAEATKDIWRAVPELSPKAETQSE